MSLESRSKTFINGLGTRPPLRQPSYTMSYWRLVAIRRVTECLIGAILIIGGQSLLVQYTFFSPLWPTTGVALSAVFLRGNFILLGIFLGSVVSYVNSHVTWEASLALSLLFCLYVFLIRQLAIKMIGPVAPLNKLTVLWKFITLVALLSAGHLILLFKLVAYTFSFAPSFFHVLIGWLGEMNGILCLTPLCLIFDPFAPRYYFKLENWRWWVYGIALISCHLIYYWLPSPNAMIGFSLFLFLPLTAYAKNFGQIPTCFTLLGSALFYLTGITPTHLFQHPAPASIIETMVILFTLQILTCLSISTYVRRKLATVI